MVLCGAHVYKRAVFVRILCYGIPLAISRWLGASWNKIKSSFYPFVGKTCGPDQEVEVELFGREETAQNYTTLEVGND